MNGGDLPQLGARKSVPKLSTNVDWSRQVLDAVQMFVLSRVDGRTSLGEICLLAPFPESETVSILQSLFVHGLIDLPVPRPAPPPEPPKPPPSVKRPPEPAPHAARSRDITPPVVLPVPPRATPAVQAPSHGSDYGAGAPSRVAAPNPAPAAPVPPTVTDSEPRRWTKTPPAFDIRKEAATYAPTPPTMAGLGVVTEPAASPPVKPVDPDSIDLSAEMQMRIDQMLNIAGQGDPFLLLELPPGSDKKEVRRAYFRLSKEFHPDRYFGKRLGAYGKKMQHVFTALTDAFQKAGK